MRWFIDVTPMGAVSPASRFCIEATRWQAALQAVRRARDETGAFSNFYIELVEQGYRALHPESRTRYVVTRAPDDAAVTPGLAAVYDSLPPSEPPPLRSSRPPVTTVPNNGKVPSTRFSSERPTQPSGTDRATLELLHNREQEPTPGVPMLYREQAYFVPAGTHLDTVSHLLWEQFRQVAHAIDHRPKGKFIQIAVFDHRFTDRPERPPIATLMWKDWRGNPALHFPRDPKRDSIRAWPENGEVAHAPSPAAVESAASLEVSAVDADWGVSDGDAAAPAASEPTPFTAPPNAVPIPPIIEVIRAAEAPVVAVPAPVAVPVPISVPAPQSEPAPATLPIVPSAVGKPFEAPAPVSVPAAITEPVASVRRHGEGEDLIGELFESMHDLHFVQDVVSGAQFVLTIVSKTLPAELTLIHVFDIDSAQFVVVRAQGNGARELLLYRTPDSDPLFDRVMRRDRSLHVPDAAADPGFQGGRWGKAAITPRVALCGGVKLGGRYLGAVEVINPLGGEPFHASEINAFDYICEQFAEFVAARPVVIDAEVVMPNQTA